MKRREIWVITVLLILMSAFAQAEAGNKASILTVLGNAGISKPVQLSQWGDTAVCFSEADGVKRFLVLENRESGWQIVIDNPTALIQDADWPELVLDSDNAVFWTYTLSDNEIVRYHSARNPEGIWGFVDQSVYDTSSGESTSIWNTVWNDAHGGEIIRTFSITDENDNDSGVLQTQYLPADWMTDCVHLADFDVSRFPTMMISTNDHYAAENERFFRETAEWLMPEEVFIKGLMKDGAMHFLMQRADETRIYVICEYSRREVHLIRSTPLPKGTVLGYENFTDSLWIDGCCVTIHLNHPDRAGIQYIYDDRMGQEGFLFFGDHTVWQDTGMLTILYGDHPWDDITIIDWNTLPHSLDEASAQMDSKRYAMVSNPNPADRLHLREKADKGSRSQGKYYTGTPVTVLKQEGDWVQVMFGEKTDSQYGYMMKRFLNFGRSGSALRLETSAMPQMFSKYENLKLYQNPQEGPYDNLMNADWTSMKIIGVIGNEWFHVWVPAAGKYGYVRQNDLTPGNG